MVGVAHVAALSISDKAKVDCNAIDAARARISCTLVEARRASSSDA